MEQHPITKAIRIQTERTREGEHSTPVFLTSSFCFDNAEDMRAAFADETDDNIYSRFSNPTVKEFIDKMVTLEGAEAGVATATGMSAVFATFMALLKTGDHLLSCDAVFGSTHNIIKKYLPVATATGMSAVFATFMALLKTGDHLLSCDAVFGSTHNIIKKYLPGYGIECTYVSADKPEEWEAAIKPNTKMIYLETPTNPALEIIDLEFVSTLAKKYNLIVNVDNCFATPVNQRPIDFGAHIVLHSATKWIDGQGRVLGGVIVGDKKLVNDIYLFCRNTGPSLSPFNAWVLTKSLETLDVRMERHAKNALHIANALENHPKISCLKYPFLKSHPQYDIAVKQMQNGGGVLCFELKGGLESGRKFLNSLEMLTLTANLGDSRSIASHPASTTHGKLTEEERLKVNITPGLIRISVGLEYADDILNDILQALEKC